MTTGDTLKINNFIGLHRMISFYWIFSELRDKLKSAETVRQRMIEAFKKTSQDFREACSQITGKITGFLHGFIILRY